MTTSAAMLFYIGNTYSCTEFYINKNNFHISARTLDFGVSLGNNLYYGYPGTENTSRIIPLPSNIVKEQKPISWNNRYGYFGRTAWESTNIIDGMNIQGLSVSTLELDDSQYLDPGQGHSNKKNLSVYDLPSYILSQASTVQEAISLIDSVNVVKSAIQKDHTTYIKGLGIHFSIKDKNGGSTVVQFINGKPQYIQSDALTNNPLSIEQSPVNTNCNMSNLTEGFNNINNDSRTRLYVVKNLLNCIAPPKTTNQALYNAEVILDKLTVPYNLKWGTATEWKSIKDLDNKKVYYKNMIDILSYNQDEIDANPITNGWNEYDLNNMGLNYTRPSAKGIKPIEKEELAQIKILSLSE
ncbi:linear amide C-N hydrolase [Francisellaceae bacterium]|nr:linear amide C-N hydrolase [Francisellaceae bacterium]